MSDKDPDWIDPARFAVLPDADVPPSRPRVVRTGGIDMRDVDLDSIHIT